MTGSDTAAIMGAIDLYTASIREKLWHKMRSDLAKFVPDITDNQLLMCCTCGRFLSQEFFNLEHLIPQQSLKLDPIAVQLNPDTPKNIRAGNLLLCKKPLRVKGHNVFNNGCNSWKGRFYDKPITEFVSEKTLRTANVTSAHIIGALCLGYLAMVAEFGYAVALMPSGLLMRRQFFSPYKYLRDLPLRHQMVLGGSHPTKPENPIWSNPFSFTFSESGCCYVGARNFSVVVPITRDPRLPFATHLPIVPERYKLRPNFKTFFDP
jgi:hypothetical protein